MLAGSGDRVAPRRWPQDSGIARKTRKTSPWAKQTTAPSVHKKEVRLTQDQPTHKQSDERACTSCNNAFAHETVRYQFVFQGLIPIDGIVAVVVGRDGVGSSRSRGVRPKQIRVARSLLELSRLAKNAIGVDRIILRRQSIVGVIAGRCFAGTTRISLAASERTISTQSQVESGVRGTPIGIGRTERPVRKTPFAVGTHWVTPSFHPMVVVS